MLELYACTTLSVVHYCIYVCMFNLYATHLWAGTGLLGLVYTPHIVYMLQCIPIYVKRCIIQFEINYFYLYGFLCNLGIQYNNGISALSLSEDDIPCDEIND